MTAHYKAATYNLAKQIFVEEGKTPRDIADHFGNKPTHSTVGRWAKAPDRNGKSWYDYRDEYRNNQYEQLSTQDMVQKIFNEIRRALNADKVDADQLVKLTKSLERLAEPKFHIHIMFQMLTELLDFIKAHYQDLATEQMASAIGDFKNHLRNRLEKPI